MRVLLAPWCPNVVLVRVQGGVEQPAGPSEMSRGNASTAGIASKVLDVILSIS
jgi:hypothetical protein